MNTNGGGHIFPFYQGTLAFPGITRRDWLAGLAMQGFCANEIVSANNQTVADWSYSLADAMIEHGNGAGINQAICNLLAVIHRDGGQYAAEHGILKACEDAERIITDERRALEEMTAQRDALAAKLEGAK